MLQWRLPSGRVKRCYVGEAGSAAYVKEACKGAAATNSTPLTSTTGSKDTEPEGIVIERGSPCNALLHCCKKNKKMWLIQQPASAF